MVVGVHFLGFGKLFRAGPYWLGAALIVAAVIGTVVGVLGHGTDAVVASTGLVAAGSLFLAGGRSVLRPAVTERA